MMPSTRFYLLETVNLREVGSTVLVAEITRLPVRLALFKHTCKFTRQGLPRRGTMLAASETKLSLPLPPSLGKETMLAVGKRMLSLALKQSLRRRMMLVVSERRPLPMQ